MTPFPTPVSSPSTACRTPAVAGLFYPANPETLRREVDSHLRPSMEEPSPALAAISPHAGYVYSGETAGILFSSISLPRRVVLIGPNHTGEGHPRAVSPAARWSTPIGDVGVDIAFRDRLLELDPTLALDAAAHRREHGLEVQLPFLLRVRPDVEVVPIVLGPLSHADATRLGRLLARVARECGGETLFIASSDMNHYESEAVTLRKDSFALERWLALDPEGLYRQVVGRGVSMCGFVPATVALVAAAELGGRRTALLDHRTSGDVTGERDEVVGYAAATVS